MSLIKFPRSSSLQGDEFNFHKKIIQNNTKKGQYVEHGSWIDVKIESSNQQLWSTTSNESSLLPRSSSLQGD